jgi:hypothetical protein
MIFGYELGNARPWAIATTKAHWTYNLGELVEPKKQQPLVLRDK